MFKKFLAGLASVTLAVGFAVGASAVPAYADSAPPAPPAAGAGETCATFNTSFWWEHWDPNVKNQVSQVSANGKISVRPSNFDIAGQNWIVTNTGDPISRIKAFYNNQWQDRPLTSPITGQGDMLGVQICTKAAPPVDPTPYVLVAWKMPTWVGPQTPSWSPFQTFYAKVDLATKDLNALDSQLTECNTQYQIDLYKDSATTAALIAGGKLYGPNNPTEDFPSPSGWDLTYKLVRVLACDSAADVTAGAQPTCQVPGSVQFTISNADWNEAENQTPGEHTRTATAWAGHTFPGGLSIKSVTYTVPDKLSASGPDCFKPTPVKPNYSKIWQCGTFGSIDIDGANANSATTHIVYAMTAGNGQTGWNTVTATAIDGYTLQPDAKASWSIFLGVHFECYNPKVSYTLSSCYVDDSKDSFKDLVITLDNTKSTGGILFSIAPAGISEWVNAGETEQVTIAIPPGGSSKYVVFAGLFPIKVIHAIAGFETCIPIGLIGDPKHADEVCAAGEGAGGWIWVERIEGLAYTITGGTLGAPIVIEGVGNVGDPYLDGTVPLDAGTYTVSTAALPGYVLEPHPDNLPVDITINEPEENCTIDVQLACELNDGGLLLPEIANVVWTVDVPSDGNPPLYVNTPGPLFIPITIAATHISASIVGSTYGFPDGLQTSWSFQLEQGELECGELTTLAPIPTNVTWTAERCVDGKLVAATVTVGNVDGEDFFPEMNYYLDGSTTPLASRTTVISAGAHTVTADPVDPDDTIEEGSLAIWEFSTPAGPRSCDLTTLALTGAGSNPVGWAGIGYYLLVTGLALIAVRTLRRRNEVKQ